MPSCRICQNTDGNNIYTIREMMLGLRESFEYFECNKCGCIQILEIPDDLKKYYPEGYYSFKTIPKLSDNFILRFIKKHRASYMFNRSDLIGKIIVKGTKLPVFYDYFKNGGVSLNSHILDVGCGFGKFLLWMKREGFSNVSGIDPFIPETLTYKNGLTIQKKVLKDLNQDFDFIMLHHSFEHMPDPIRTLQELYRLTKPTGKVLIRIPIASSYAWRTFGTNWVALDAPRHFYLHTLKSMELLTQMSGFNIEKVVFDSFEFQFWGSIQYQRDIPLMDPRSFQINKNSSIFSKNELNKFKENSVKLNNEKQGDAAGFYLTKI